MKASGLCIYRKHPHYISNRHPRTPAPQHLQRRGHRDEARVGLRGGDGQLEGEAGQAQGGGERKGDGEPREAPEEVACWMVGWFCLCVCCVSLGGWVGGLEHYYILYISIQPPTFDGGGGAGRDGALPVGLVHKDLCMCVTRHACHSVNNTSTTTIENEPRKPVYKTNNRIVPSRGFQSHSRSRT